MKRHITAALTISALALASCKATKIQTNSPQEKCNALTWQVSSAEADYIFLQNIHLASQKVMENSTNEGTREKFLFIDVPFLMFDRQKTSEFFLKFGVTDGINIEGLRIFTENLDSNIVEFLRLCSDNGFNIHLMAPQKDCKGVIKELSKLDIIAKYCTFKGYPQYGRSAVNLTLNEALTRNDNILILGTSINELEKSLVGNDTLFQTRKLLEKLILFPNPAFN